MTGVATGADFIFIPEEPPKADWEDQMCQSYTVLIYFNISRAEIDPGQIVKKHRAMGKRKTIVIVCEGAHDLNLNKISPNTVKDLLTTRAGLDTRVTTLGRKFINSVVQRFCIKIGQMYKEVEPLVLMTGCYLHFRELKLSKQSWRPHQKSLVPSSALLKTR